MKGKKQTKEEFIEKANIKFNNEFDYSQSNYINTTTQIEIICKKHGLFKQTPELHLTSVTGCSKCGKEKMASGKTHNTESFKVRSHIVHNNFYNYDKSIYTQADNIISITCPIHGDFEQVAMSHIRGHGCKICKNENGGKNRTKSHEKYIKDVTHKHKGFYNYDKTKYVKGSEKITITCSIHGDFNQQANAHAAGQGCPTCGYGLTYSRSNYVEKAKGRECIFYTLRCFNENEEFYKIGITMNTIKRRYCAKEDMPYEYEVIKEVKGSAGFIWDLELAEKRKLVDFRYQPELEFNGSKTECFTNYKV